MLAVLLIIVKKMETAYPIVCRKVVVRSTKFIQQLKTNFIRIFNDMNES